MRLKWRPTDDGRHAVWSGSRCGAMEAKGGTGRRMGGEGWEREGREGLADPFISMAEKPEVLMALEEYFASLTSVAE